MKSQKQIAVFIIVLYIALLYFSPPSYINKPKFLFLSVIKFPLRLVNQAFYNLSNLMRSKEMVAENISLKRTLDSLSFEIAKYKDIGAENIRLTELLGFKKASAFKLVAARVIGRDSSNLSDTIIVDRGERSGIKKDNVVISPGGLVGRVLSSSPSMSEVILITDPDSRVSSIILRSRQTGIVYGISSRMCKIRYLPLDADLMLGDEVMTSGISDIYPKGILLGRVVKIIKEPRGLTMSALIEPVVDLSRIEEVLCIG